MGEQKSWTIKKATNQQDTIIAQHFYQLWLDNNFSAQLLLVFFFLVLNLV